tara:strand:- start:445 stop:906 length:462 start_codon:yes stop_codon:yes gene_type:complete
MRKIILLINVVLLSIVTFAQNTGEAPLTAGQKQLNFGVGFSGYGIPTYIGLDFAVHNDITVGPVAKLIFDNGNVRFGALGRGDYHFNRIIGIPNNFDFYAGASLGVMFGNNNTDFDFNLQVGGRYYWSEKWGINLEFGGGSGFGTSLGVSMKM